MSLSVVEDTIRIWIENNLGIETIFSFPSAPRPSDQYAMVNVISDSDVSTSQTKKTFIGGDQTVDIDYSVLSNAFISIRNVSAVWGSKKRTAFCMASFLKDSLNLGFACFNI